MGKHEEVKTDTHKHAHTQTQRDISEVSVCKSTSEDFIVRIIVLVSLFIVFSAVTLITTALFICITIKL